MSRTNNTKRNIIWGGIQAVSSAGIPFITRTILIYTLGIEYTGLSGLFSSLLQMLSFAELGIGSALAYSMYEPVAKNDTPHMCALLNLYKKCYQIIGLIILTIGMALMPFLNHFVAGDIPPDINIYSLFGIYLFNTVSGYFLFAYKQSIFTATQRVDIISKTTLFIHTILNLIQIFVLVFTKNYYIYILVLPISTCAMNILTAHLAKKAYPQYICSGKVSKQEIRTIGKKAGGVLAQKIGNIILCNVDTIVISAFLGLKILGIFNGYFFIVSSVFSLMWVIQRALIPSVGNSIVGEDIEKNYKDFNRLHFLYLWVVSWCCACLLCLFQPFMELWQGKDNMLSTEIVVLFVIYFFVYKMGDMSYVYKEAIGLWWQGKFVPLISSVVNLTLNIIFVKLIGLPGILLSTIISACCINTPFGSWVLFKHYFHSQDKWKKFLMDTLIYFLKCTLVCGGTYWLCSLTPAHGIIAILIRALICLVVPNLILLLLNFRNKRFLESKFWIITVLPEKIRKKFI